MKFTSLTYEVSVGEAFPHMARCKALDPTPWLHIHQRWCYRYTIASSVTMLRRNNTINHFLTATNNSITSRKPNILDAHNISYNKKMNGILTTVHAMLLYASDEVFRTTIKWLHSCIWLSEQSWPTLDTSTSFYKSTVLHMITNHIKVDEWPWTAAMNSNQHWLPVCNQNFLRCFLLYAYSFRV